MTDSERQLKMMPREPSNGMMEKGADALDGADPSNSTVHAMYAAAQAWRAMWDFHAKGNAGAMAANTLSV